MILITIKNLNMKQVIIIVLALILSINIQAQKLKPYILGAECGKTLTEAKSLVKTNLKEQGFKILGEYKAANDANRWVIIISNSDLINAVKKEKGLTGFAAALRVALTVESGKIMISYTNPEYWGNAYFRDDFTKVSSLYKSFSSKLIAAMKKSGKYKGTAFGSEDGVAIDDIREYQYMFGMPEFDDIIELGDFNSFTEAKQKVESNLKKGISGLKLVYSIAIPGTELKLYGIALTATEGEKTFLPIIDQSSPKHTAFLPYEILVKGDKVIMLHGRYRIALAFPDLSMNTFRKIMSTPGYIEDQLKKTCN